MSQKPKEERPAAYAVEVAKNVAKFGIPGIATFFDVLAVEIHRHRPEIDMLINKDKP